MMKLFSEGEKIVIPGLIDAQLEYVSNLLTSDFSNICFQKLLEETPWQQDDIRVFGKVYKQPRLTALYGESGKPYSYSNIIMHPHSFTPLLLTLKEKVEKATDTRFNTVLLNLYRDGSDSNGWHSDDETELGENPVIASLSLGAKRKFHLRHKTIESARYSIELEHGSLLLMKGSTQHYWQHQLPKSKCVSNPRINLTFRIIKN